ncbi:MAG: ORF6N domain-containing protein [Myxococcaceae bacterium]
MENSIEITSSELSKRIYTLRGVQVMLDTDLAESYQVEVRVLKRAVRENIERFPKDFMFELSKEEVENLRSKFWISSLEDSEKSDSNPILRSKFATSNQHGGSRYMPFAFTEAGIAMLSGVLHSHRAIQVNIGIMRVFVELRKKIRIPIEAIEQRLDRLESQSWAGKSIQSSANIIQNIVAEHFGLQVEELKAPTRTQAILRARHIAIYLMRKHTHMSFNEIGWHFGQRDHSTVLHACQKIEAISGKIKNLDHRVFSALASKA